MEKDLRAHFNHKAFLLHDTHTRARSRTHARARAPRGEMTAAVGSSTNATQFNVFSTADIEFVRSIV